MDTKPSPEKAELNVVGSEASISDKGLDEVAGGFIYGPDGEITPGGAAFSAPDKGALREPTLGEVISVAFQLIPGPNPFKSHPSFLELEAMVNQKK
jgi:hypothetical protein